MITLKKAESFSCKTVNIIYEGAVKTPLEGINRGSPIYANNVFVDAVFHDVLHIKDCVIDEAFDIIPLKEILFIDTVDLEEED